MDPATLFVLLSPIIPIAVAIVVTRRSKKGRVESAWRTVASQFRFGFEPEKPTLAGEAHGLWVTVSVAEGDTPATVVDVQGRGAIPIDVSIGPPGFLAEGPAPLIRTGDAAFDAAVAWRGDPARAHALLDERARRIVAASVAIHGTRVDDGRAVLRVPWVVEDPVSLAELVQRAIDFGRELVKDAGLERLVHNATRDPNPAVRAVVTAWIASRGEKRETTDYVLDCALTDADPAVRRAAIGALGADAAAWLTARIDRDGPPDGRVRALRMLDETAPRETSFAVIERLLDAPVPELRREAIYLAGRGRHARAAPRLAALTRNPDAAVAAAAAAALGELEDPAAEAEEALLAALARFEAPVKQAAALALGRVGSVRSVEALLAAAQGLFADAEVKRLSRLSVKAIQARLGGGVERGGLTVADSSPEAGRIELVSGGELGDPDESGRSGA